MSAPSSPGLDGAPAMPECAPRPWHEAAWRRHRHAALVITAAVLLACLVMPMPSLSAQLVATAIGVAIVGLPHGGADVLPGRRVFSRWWPRRWAVPFTVYYVALVAAVIVFWLSWPVVALSAFLLISALHFGDGDMDASLTPPMLRPAEAMVRGGVPLFLTIALHVGEVGELFSYLLPGYGPAAVTAWVGTALPWIAPVLALAAASVVAWHGHAALAGDRRGDRLMGLAELALLAGLFALAAPLIAFTVYFVLWHSLRHSIEVAARADPHDPGRGLRRFARLSVGPTVATVAGAAGAWAILRQVEMSVNASTTAVIFITLAAVTVPHVILEAAYRTGLPAPAAPVKPV